MDGNQDLSGLLQGVLGDPEAMKKIAALAAGLKLGGRGEEDIGRADTGRADTGKAGGNDGGETEERSETKERRRPESGKGGENEPDIQNRIKLIDALKPYLSEERREAADKIVRVMKIIGLIDIEKLLGGF